MDSKGVIHIVRTHQGGVSPKRTLFIKSTIFPIQNAYWGGGGGGTKCSILCIRTM